MKKIFIMLFVVAVCTLAYAGENQKVFCQIVGQSNGFTPKVKISIDYGQEMKFGSDNRLVDESGQVIKFNSMIDALNYMGSKGWKFEQAYAITLGNANVYHYLLSKEISEGQDINEGLKTKQDFKKEQ